MDASQSGITILDRCNDNSDGHDVKDLIKIFTFLDHLLVNTPQVFATSSDISINV